MELTDSIYKFAETIDNTPYFSSKKTVWRINSDGELKQEPPETFMNMGGSQTSFTFIALLLYFDVLDGLIDQNNPDLIGENFTHKYQKMKKVDPFQHILGEVFRIFLILRNTFTHNKTHLNNFLSISYTVRGRNIELKIGDTPFYYLVTMIKMIYFISKNNSYYEKCILFNHFKIFITMSDFKINDQFGNKVFDVDVPFSFFTNERYQYETKKFHITEEKIIIEKILHQKCIKDNEIGFDYIIKYNGNEYIVPEEALTPSFEMALDQFELWKIC